MRVFAIAFLLSSATVLCAWRALATAPSPGAAAPESAEEPADAGSRRVRQAILEHRLAALDYRVSAGAAAPGAAAASAADADVNRWIMAALGEGGPMTLGEERAEDWINGLLGWVAHDREMNHADLEFAPLRERFVAEWLSTRGAALTADQRAAFEGLMAEAEGAFAQHLADTAGRPDEERLISGLRATAGWDRRLSEILTPDQVRALEPLAVVLDQWRWQPSCEPREVDPAKEGGLDPLTSVARERLNPGDLDRALPILEDHARALVAMHREVHAARLRDPAAVTDVEEFIRYLEIRVQTRKRLVMEAGLRAQDLPPEILMDCAAPFEADGEEDR